MAKAKGEKKEKKKRKNRIASKKWSKYEVSGDKIKRKKSCPRCGGGIFMAEHKNRFTCGKCAYTEMR